MQYADPVLAIVPLDEEDRARMAALQLDEWNKLKAWLDAQKLGDEALSELVKKFGFPYANSATYFNGSLVILGHKREKKEEAGA